VNEPNLLVICGAAFVAVMVLLAFLAGVITILMRVFPEKSDDFDAGVMAAIHSAVAAAYPATKITGIEEVR
jgi:hypothetical protein